MVQCHVKISLQNYEKKRDAPKKGAHCLTTGALLNLYNNTRMRITALSEKRLLTVFYEKFSPQKYLLRLAPLHRGSFGIANEKGWSSDFPPLPSAFSSKWTMASLLRSHNGVYCCGTVGDSHSRSQLIAAKRTFSCEGWGLGPHFRVNSLRIALQMYKEDVKYPNFIREKRR